MPWRQPQTLERHEVGIRIGRLGEMVVDCTHHLFILMRSRDREHARMLRLDTIGLHTQTARYDHLAILRHRFANGLQTFLLGAIEEAAGVNQHQIGIGVVAGQAIALGAQTANDPL